MSLASRSSPYFWSVKTSGFELEDEEEKEEQRISVEDAMCY